MGRVRTKTVKRAAKVLLEKHYQKLTSDFHINKKILSQVAKVPTKSLRNKIAGYATHLMKRIQKGPVKGISLKVQEQERERRLDWVPKQSQIKIEKVTIDTETAQMLKKRFNPEFFKKIEDNLEIKAYEQAAKKDTRGNKKRGQGKRQGRQGRQGKDTRQPRQGKQPRQARGQRKPREKVQNKQAPKQGATEQPKRQGRRKGRGQPRQGQQ